MVAKAGLCGQTVHMGYGRIAILGTLALAVATGTTPALASSTDWFETQGGRIRLVTAGVPDAQGRVTGVLDIALDPGWKTYWRDPGDSGVPPQIMVDGPEVRQAELSFPAPTRHDDGYSEWAGYDSSVLLPIQFTLAGHHQPATIAAKVMIGMCERICIPVHADLVVDPDRSSQQVVEEAMVHNALAALPAPASPGFEASIATASDDTLTVEATLPEDARSAELFLAGEGGYAFATPVAKPADGKLVFEVPVVAKPAHKPDGQGLPYTLTSSAGAVSGFLPYP